MSFIKKIGKKRIILFAIILILFLTLFILSSTLPLNYISNDGFDFMMLPDGTYRITGYSGNKTYLEIPKTVRGVEVTEIRQFAFKNNTRIKTVVVHDNITEIGLGAFMGCTSIESLTVPFVGCTHDNNTRLAQIFSDRVGISTDTSTPVPKSLKRLYITKGCTKISDSAFSMCTGLNEVHIPSTVTRIEDGTGYISIGVNGHSPGSAETNLPFYGCSSNLKIYCASSKKPEGWGKYWSNTSFSHQATVIWSSKEY